MKVFLFLAKLVLVLVLLELSASETDQPSPIEGDDQPLTHKVKFSRGETGIKKDDLILSEDQNAWLFGNDDEATNRTKRAGTTNIYLWENGIVPYIINTKDFSVDEQQEIRQAMDVYEEQTCLKFVQRTREPQWLFITHTNDGCYSYLGNARAYFPGAQTVSLQEPGCRQFGTYLHELGHAIGLVHEHQLPTRDRYVRYYGTNVDANNLDQLEMYNARVINTFNTPYDLGSIMHYDITSFSIDDMSPTLGVDNPWLAQHIGRRYSDMLSFGDVRTVNRLYKCSRTNIVTAQCSMKLKKSCPDPGFVNKKCECITPQIYHNQNCKDEPGMEAFCHGLVPKGKCDVESLELHKICKKSCGFCPIFKPGDSAIGPVQLAKGKLCIDRYHNPMMCRQWAGFCKTSPWMHRYCRKSCGACKSNWGDCANNEPDRDCDQNARFGRCKGYSISEFLQVNCADSCGTCGLRNQDPACRNVASDEQCLIWARDYQCEKNPIKMFAQCPSTCNRCYWNKGNCKNQVPEQECIQKGLQNHCVAGGQIEAEMKMKCPKTCDSCRGTG